MISVCGFDRQASTPVTEIITVHLAVDSCQTYNIPLLITNLGPYDLILRRKFFKHYDVWLDVKN